MIETIHLQLLLATFSAWVGRQQSAVIGACFVITLLGTALQSIPVLAIAATAAFFAIFPPNHPFDYLYNLTVGRLMNRPTCLRGPIRVDSRVPSLRCGWP
jgi:hypothetical protein